MSNHTYEIFEENGYYGYKISRDGKLFIIQSHAPAVSGMIRLSQDEATTMAEMVCQKLNNEKTSEEENELKTLIEKSYESLTTTEKERIQTLVSKGDPTLTISEVETIIKK